MDENAIVMQSKISQIKDIFPEYGNGCLAACLEAYNQNPEEVIQRILEGTLHEDLQRLDTSLETMPQPKSAPTLRSKDKGKGKLIEFDTSSSHMYTEQPITRPLLPASAASSASSASSTTVGRFVRKPKDDTPNYKILDARKDSDRERNAELLAQHEYDDEYDDSFDDLGLSVAESGTEESGSFGNRAESAGSEPSAATKWSSRKNPQFYVKDGKNYREQQEEKGNENNNNSEVTTEAENGGGRGRGRGRGRGGGGGRNNHNHKDRAMKKHIASVSGF